MRKKNKELTHLAHTGFKIDDGTDRYYKPEKNPYPCYQCKERELNCHEWCEKYLQAKKLKGAKK